MNARSCFAAVAVVALSAVARVEAAEAARMALPEGFGEQSTRLQAEGFGGRNKGTYTLGNYAGQFTRSESRLGIFDPMYVSNKGKSSFTFTPAGDDAPLDAECEMRKGTATIGIVTFDPKKMKYECGFRRGTELLGARFVLGQPKPQGMKEKFLAKDARRGEAVFDDRHFTLQSVHAYEGTRFTSQTPVGYLVNSGDRVIAAVELTDWNPSVLLAGDMTADEHEAVMIIALAVAVLRDPANSALED